MNNVIERIHTKHTWDIPALKTHLYVLTLPFKSRKTTATSTLRSNRVNPTVSTLRTVSYLHGGEEEEGEAAALLSHGCPPCELLTKRIDGGEWEPQRRLGDRDPITSLIWADCGIRDKLFLFFSACEQLRHRCQLNSGWQSCFKYLDCPSYTTFCLYTASYSNMLLVRLVLVSSPFFLTKHLNVARCLYLKFLDDGGALHLYFKGFGGDSSFLQENTELMKKHDPNTSFKIWKPWHTSICPSKH